MYNYEKGIIEYVFLCLEFSRVCKIQPWFVNVSSTPAVVSCPTRFFRSGSRKSQEQRCATPVGVFAIMSHSILCNMRLTGSDVSEVGIVFEIKYPLFAMLVLTIALHCHHNNRQQSVSSLTKSSLLCGGTRNTISRILKLTIGTIFA